MKRLTAYRKTRRGSALLLALVLTVVLFLMGLAFVSNTQTDKVIVSGTEDRVSLEQGVDAVVERINTVLVNDLFGGDGNLLNGKGDSDPGGLAEADEYYDYPGEDDPWLASLEPYEYSAGVYLWRHISDIYGQDQIPPYDLNDGTFFNTWYDPVDRNDPTQWDGNPPSAPYHLNIGSITGILARIVGETEGTEIIQQAGSWTNPLNINLWGARADADGDGVADSRWVQIPNISGPRGQNLYTAVRIIDNCGMMNVNTAFRDPSFLANNTTSPPVANDWDGSRLSHISLENIMRPSETTGIAGFQMARLGNNEPATVSLFPDTPPNITDTTDYANDFEYDKDVAQRVLNPAILLDSASTPNPYHYTPFDIMDELEFRNRYFIDNQMLISRTENLWTKTFMGNGNLTKTVPYVDSADLSKWFQKAYYDPTVTDLYTRRHICTTYSFDRITRPWFDLTATPLPQDMEVPNGQRKAIINQITATATLEGQTIAQLAGAIYMGLLDDATIQERFGSQYDREKLAWQFAVNLIDYQDDDQAAGGSDDRPTYVTANNITYFGVENEAAIRRDTILVSKIAHVRISAAQEQSLGIPAGDYYAIELFNPDGVIKNITAVNDYEIKIGNATTISLNGVGINSLLPEDVRVITNKVPINTTNAFGTIGVTFAKPPETVAGTTFANGDTITVVKKNWPASGEEMPVDLCTVQGVTNSSAERRELGNGSGGLPFLLLPDFGGSPGILGQPPAPNADYDIQLETTNTPLRGIGEIENVVAVGYYHDNNANQYHVLAESVDASKSAIENTFTAGGGIAADADKEPVLNIDQGTYGRIKLSDPDYWGLMNYLTCFDPSNDNMDNDGQTTTSDNPMLDEIDQDGDHKDAPAALVALPDAEQPTPPYTAGPDPDENLPQYYEQMVAGRININTAPWFVIKQLPWLAWRRINNGNHLVDSESLARGIVAFRDKLDLSPAPTNGPNYSGAAGRLNETNITGIDENLGFKNIAQLLQVITTTVAPLPQPSDSLVSVFDIRQYMDNQNEDASNLTAWPPPNPGAPDYSTDNLQDDFEERNLLFHRISNLVTVRSDVFTAYILVRLGERGPQKRVIAIFDRSNVFNSSDTPRLVALQPVPDPR